MKINELMIGDWVYGLYPNGERYANPFRISAIDIYPENKSPRIVTYGGYGFQLEHLEPIPLTPEILEKNGWKLRHNEGFLFCLDEERELYIDVLDGEIANYFRNIAGDYEWHLIAYCKYVHELQHALKLCGIEKEIVL